MRTISVEQSGRLYLGMQGEHGAQPIGFDVSAWEKEYGPGQVQMLVQRCGDEDPYPVVVRREGSLAIWQVERADTLYAGTGEAQLLYFVNEKVVKSRCFATDVTRSLGSIDPDAPPAQEGWVQQVLAAGTKAQTAGEQSQKDAARAEAAQQSAALSQENAKKSENAAADSQKAAENSEKEAKDAADVAQQYRQDVTQLASQTQKNATIAENAKQQAAKDSATAQEAAKEASGAAVEQSFVQTQENGAIVSGRFAPGAVQAETRWKNGTVSPQQLRLAICRGNVFKPTDTAIGSGGVDIHSLAGRVTVSGLVTLPSVREKAFEKGVWLPAGTYTLKLENPCQHTALNVQVCRVTESGAYQEKIAKVAGASTGVMFRLQEDAMVNIFVEVSSSLSAVHWASYVWIEYGDTRKKDTVFDPYQRQDLVQSLQSVKLPPDSECKFDWNNGVVESIQYMENGQIVMENTDLQVKRELSVPYGRYIIMTNVGKAKITARRHPEEAMDLLRGQIRHAPKILPPMYSQDMSLPGYCRVSDLNQLPPDGKYLIVTRDSAGAVWALYASDIAENIDSGALTTAGCHAKLTMQNHMMRAVDYAGNPVKREELQFTLSGDENGMYFQSREKYLWLDDKMFCAQPSRLSVQITPEGELRIFNKNPGRPFRILNFNKTADPKSKYPDHVTDFWGGYGGKCERFPLYLYQELPWTWHVWDVDKEAYVDTGVAATQPDEMDNSHRSVQLAPNDWSAQPQEPTKQWARVKCGDVVPTDELSPFWVSSTENAEVKKFVRLLNENAEISVESSQRMTVKIGAEIKVPQQPMTLHFHVYR